jgi:hypothetical protein
MFWNNGITSTRKYIARIRIPRKIIKQPNTTANTNGCYNEQIEKILELTNVAIKKHHN